MPKLTLAHGRIYVARRHLHHGFTGCMLMLLGALLAYHDRRDFPWPLTLDR